MLYFTSKDETPDHSKLREMIGYNVHHEKMISIDIRYKLAPHILTSDEKILKIKRLL